MKNEKKIDINNIYIGLLEFEKANGEKGFRKILFSHEPEATAKDLLFYCDDYNMSQDAKDFKVVRLLRLRNILRELRFKDELSKYDITTIYYKLVKNDEFIKNCAFLFGYSYDGDEDKFYLVDSSNMSSKDFIELVELSKYNYKISKEEKELHDVKSKYLLF